MKPFLALAAAALLSAPLLAQGGGGPFTVRETGQGFGSLQDAVSAIGNARGTIVIAPGRYRQCAVQEGGEVSYTAAQPGTAVFDREACEGKAALVLRGRAANVSGLIFQNMHVPDGNGAGIRLEQGNLVVRESLFRDSESGILSANDPAGRILVEQSTFSGLGACPDGGDCAHSIYIGGYGGLTVRRSRFERGRGGHYVKSRAARIEVTDSSFDDTSGHKTNYMIDLPAGATGTIARNAFVQGRDKENYSGLIVVAAEGATNSSNGLTVADNEARLAPGQVNGTAFVADLSGDSLRIGANRLGPKIERFQRR
ncbi:MAG: right-handed parallel beta-helix repeat-containing protein [Alphaproteobacteria bacterium]|nr:right-handed parallel beta-helix repeat-containing protein [Alphaproteobacteria bacterium]MBV9370417.1 right-handed parallel beta-helix repeat-containing protein [Alphaproteobacteria bacterium]MBV9900843.1 right-handed parallel beta-helix repeat-containing protein [Alphaproteobacteria bacterium]